MAMELGMEDTFDYLLKHGLVNPRDADSDEEMTQADPPKVTHLGPLPEDDRATKKVKVADGENPEGYVQCAQCGLKITRASDVHTHMQTMHPVSSSPVGHLGEKDEIMERDPGEYIPQIISDAFSNMLKPRKQTRQGYAGKLK